MHKTIIEYEEGIAKQKMQTFESELGRKKNQRSNGKFVAVCFVRYLFGSLSFLTLVQNIGVIEILS